MVNFELKVPFIRNKLSHCEVCQLFHQIISLRRFEEQRKYVTLVSSDYFNAVRQEDSAVPFQALQSSHLAQIRPAHSTHLYVHPFHYELQFLSEEI